MTWTPTTIATATATAARLIFEAHDYAIQTTDDTQRAVARIIEDACGHILAELPAGYPEAIEPGANPGGWVAVIVDTAGNQIRVPFNRTDRGEAVRAVWTPMVLVGTAWRLVIFDGDDGLVPLEVWTGDQFRRLIEED